MNSDTITGGRRVTERKAIKDRFLGRTAIVTGGSAGIGKAVVAELLKEGANVVFSGISTRGQATEAAFKEQGYDAVFMQGDMADEGFCHELVDKTVERYGAVHYLVNNAFSFIGKGEDATREDFLRSYEAGPLAYAETVLRAWPHMKEAGGGAIVNMSSISGHIAQKDRWTYNSSKGAVQLLTKCQAMDLAKYNIRVNSVSPAFIWSDLVYGMLDHSGGGKERYDKLWGKYHMLGRCGETVECAAVILFLLSDDASFLTAIDVPIDGGYLAMGPEGYGWDTLNSVLETEDMGR